MTAPARKGRKTFAKYMSDGHDINVTTNSLSRGFSIKNAHPTLLELLVRP